MTQCLAASSWSSTWRLDRENVREAKTVIYEIVKKPQRRGIAEQLLAVWRRYPDNAAQPFLGLERTQSRRLKRDENQVGSSSRFRSLIEHDPFAKPLHTLRLNAAGRARIMLQRDALDQMRRVWFFSQAPPSPQAQSRHPGTRHDISKAYYECPHRHQAVRLLKDVVGNSKVFIFPLLTCRRLPRELYTMLLRYLVKC